MTDPVLMFVSGVRRALEMQRDHDPAVMRVLPILTHGAHRGSAIIVEMPPIERLGSRVVQDEFDRWLEWLPTRLTPGEGKRITIVG